MVAGGVELGLIIADFHITTGVAHGGMCASACVMAWAAGTVKSAARDSQVGVHMAADSPQGDPAVDGTILNVRWLQKTGAPKTVVVGAMSTQPDDIYWLSEDELVAWGAKVVAAETNQAVAAKKNGAGTIVAEYCRLHPGADSCHSENRR